MSKNRKIRHHYISSFLCKNFSSDKKSIFRYDADLGNIIKTSVKDGFVKKELYTVLDRAGNKSDALENLLGEIEYPASVAINKILENLENLDEIDEIEAYGMYMDILNFCILSHLRTPKKIHDVKLSMLRITYAASYLHLRAKKVDLNANFTLAMDPVRMMLYSIASLEGIFKECLDCSMSIVLHKSTKKFFVLPDQPVALEFEGRGEFMAPDLQILFPIASNVLLIFSRNRAGAMTEIGEDEIDHYNQRICARYYGRIACESEDYLDYFTSNFEIPTNTAPTDEEFEVEKEKMEEEVNALFKDNPKGAFELMIHSSKDGIKFVPNVS